MRSVAKANQIGGQLAVHLLWWLANRLRSRRAVKKIESISRAFHRHCFNYNFCFHVTWLLLIDSFPQSLASGLKVDIVNTSSAHWSSMSRRFERKKCCVKFPINHHDTTWLQVFVSETFFVIVFHFLDWNSPITSTRRKKTETTQCTRRESTFSPGLK